MLLIASLIFYAWGEPVYILLMLASIVANWLFGILVKAKPKRVKKKKIPEIVDEESPTPREHTKKRIVDTPKDIHDISITSIINPDDLQRDTSNEPAQIKQQALATTPKSEKATSSSAEDEYEIIEPKRNRLFVLILAIIFNCLVIGFFKYEGFLATNINALFGFEVMPDLKLPLPIGISFYTLQALSYVIDVYRNEVKPQKNILYLGMYVACFPQLIAGPIVRYQTIEAQIVGRRETLSQFSDGMRLFIIGFAKKALLANTCAMLATKMLSMGGSEIGAIGAWAGLIAYTFQIFFDFSGYSDMAIGLGRMMGFHYLRNFNYPYISRSITEFWRRWHISLSTFFRDYIYIPLGGSRCSNGRWIFNIAVVWAITGLWHGAAWNYILWGVYYGFLLICEKMIWGKALNKAPAIIGHIYTIIIFVFGWSFFWITDAEKLFQFWAALVGQFGPTGSSTFWELTAWQYLFVGVICIVASTPIVPFIKERILAFVEKRKAIRIAKEGIVNPRHLSAEELCVFEATPATTARKYLFYAARTLSDILLLGLLAASSASIVTGSFNPFIYFQF